jgi:hypothetical protein
MRRTATPAIACLVILASLLVAGCAIIDGKDQVGRLIASWSQGDFREIETIAPEGTLVLDDDGARTDYLQRVPDDALDTEAVRQADLSSGFLVLGAYNKCMDRSRVWMDDRRTAVWFEDYVPREDRNTACAWAPLTIDVWLVPGSELAEVDAADLTPREPA